MSMARSLVAILLLSTLGLTGCHSPTPPQEVLEHQQVEKMVADFLVNLSGENPLRPMDTYSLPFWAKKHWILTEEQLELEIPTAGPDNAITLQQVGVRLYPIGDLEVLNPDAWQSLEQARNTVADLSDLYLAAVRAQFEERGQNRDETGWLLVRRTETGWKVAGVVM